MIKNPILRGMNPDPSCIRVGNSYYIATSTFEWWPGVCIYKSIDLKNWKLVSRPLKRKTQLDLSGVPNGGGVWAPCLSYDGEEIFLLYTNVRERGPMMQTDNFLVTTKDIDSDMWSEPVYINSMGFDPTLFHNDDGKKYIVNLDNHYKDGKRFNGLFIQEYDHKNKCMTGERKRLYTEPNGELVEGAHILKHDGMYYILKAQGGTGLRHSSQMSRSKSLFGPYEDDKQIMLHSRDNPDLYIQKAGHSDIMDTPDGDLYIVHLGARYECGNDFSIFGRETCLEKVEWRDGWLRLSHGGENPAEELEEPFESETVPINNNKIYDFRKAEDVSIDFAALRRDKKEFASLQSDGLHIKGQAGLFSRFDQSILARRVEDTDFECKTSIIFNPKNEKNMAGMVFFYDTCHWHYAYVSRNNESGRREINLLTADEGKLYYPLKTAIEIDDTSSVVIKAQVKNAAKLQYYAETDGETVKIGNELDMSILTDEHIYLGFCGTLVGMCCQDMIFNKNEAVFEYFGYSVTDSK